MSTAVAVAVAESADLVELARRLSRTRRAVLSLNAAFRLLGLGDDACAAAVAGLQDAGLLQVWERPGRRPAVVLTPLANERLGLSRELLDYNGGDSSLVWDRDPGPPRVPAGNGVVRNATDAGDEGGPLDLDAEPDPDAVAPPDAAEAADELATPAGKVRAMKLSQGWHNGVPHPYVLLGMRVPWPVRRAEGEPCPGCLGRKLSWAEACLIDGCDRAGVEPLLRPVTPEERPKHHRHTPDGLAGGTGPAPRRPAFPQAGAPAAPKKREAGGAHPPASGNP
jgi:hypothetical protein